MKDNFDVLHVKHSFILSMHLFEKYRLPCIVVLFTGLSHSPSCHVCYDLSYVSTLVIFINCFTCIVYNTSTLGYIIY